MLIATHGTHPRPRRCDGSHIAGRWDPTTPRAGRVPAPLVAVVEGVILLISLVLVMVVW